MGDISTQIVVDVTGIGEVDALADALDRAAQAASELDKALAGGMDVSGSAAGADKLAASWDKAFATMQADADRFMESMSKLGDMGSVGDAGVASLGKLDDSLKGVQEQADAAGASIGKVDDTVKGLGETSDASAAGLGRLADAQKSVTETGAGLRDVTAATSEGIKGVGAGADMSAAQLAEFNKVMADSAAVQASTAGISTDASLAMAKSSQVQADAKTALATSSVEQDAAMIQSAKLNKAAQEDAAASAEASAGKHAMLALGIAAAAGYGIDMAAKLQTAVTRLYTSAGEPKGNLAADTAGILALSGQTNESQANLASGAYWTASAGFHGKDMTAVLKAAAEGAQAEGAQVPDVANALTTVLNDYFGGPQKSSAVQGTMAMTAMNEVIGAVGLGKMTLQGLSGAMPFLLPAAKQAQLSLPQALGAEATMTSQGFSAEESAQLLKHTITSIQKPSGVQAAEMQMLGISPVQLAHDLGKQGLTGTIAEVDDAIQKHLGPGGMVMVSTLNQSKLAAQSANEMIAAMPKSIQGTADAYLKGTLSAQQWNDATSMYKSTLPVGEIDKLKQFEAQANVVLGYSSLVKSGMGDKQTVAAALNEIMGGQEGQQVALALGGTHLKTLNKDVADLGERARQTGANIEGWSAVQDTLNFKIGAFTKGLEAVATEGGEVGLPVATKALGALSDAAGFFASHPDVTKAAAGVGGVLGAGYLLEKLESPAMTAVRGVGTIAEKLNIPGLDKLANVGSGTSTAGAAADLSAAGASLDGAAASLEGAAASLKGAAVTEDAGAGGVPGAGAAGTAAAEEEDSATLGAGAILRSGAGGVLAGAVVAAITIPLAQEADKVIQEHLGNSQASGLAQIGTGAAAGAATGAMAGSVIPGLGTLVGAITGAIAGGITTAMANHSVWNDLVTPPKAAKSAPYAYGGPVPSPSGPGQEPSVGQEPGRLADVQPKGTPAEPASFAWQRAHQFDENRHHMAEAFDRTRHGIAAAADAVNSAVNTFFYGTGGTSSVGTTFGGGRAGALGDTRAVPAAPRLEPAAPRLEPAPPLEYSTFTGGRSSGAWTSVIGGTGGQAPPLGAPLDMSAAAHALMDAGHPASVKLGVTVDTSSLDAARGKIAADLAALSSSQGMKPVKIPPPDLSALNSAKGPAETAGASVASGFAGGIAAGAGAVAAAAHHLAAEAVAALTLHLQSSSPSKVTHAIGQDGFDAGFAGGITDGQGAAIAATAALGSSSVSSLVQSLEGGSESLQNAITALYGSLANPQAITTIAQEIASLGSSKWLTQQGTKLEALANQQGALEAEISGAQQIATSVIGGASVMSASGYTAAVPTAGGPQSSQSILSGMQMQLADTKQFASELTKLAKEGLNATTVDQLAQAGVTAGLPVAQGLLQGGKGTISQMNAYEAQIIKASGQIGNVGGVAGYQATLAADQATGGQLKSELSMVGSEMAKVATEVSKATGGGTSSSATSAASAGTTATAASSASALASGGKSAAGSLSAVDGAAHGAAGGLDAVDSAAHAAAAALSALVGAAGGSGSGSGAGTGGTGSHPIGGGGGAQATGGGFSPGYHGIGGYGQGGTTVHVTHNHTWQIGGPVLNTSQDLYAHVQQAALQFGSNNWNQGFNYPGRSN